MAVLYLLLSGSSPGPDDPADGSEIEEATA
jgi:hypothetical protein